MPAYDDNNIFARILRGELPCREIHRDDYALAFHDIRPQAAVHAIVIPKGRYVSADDFGATASPEEITGFTRAVAAVARQLGVAETGYRLITNIGPHSRQEVPHYHVHILGGQLMGHLLGPAI